MEVAGDVIGGAIEGVYKFASSTKGEYFITLFRNWLKLLHNLLSTYNISFLIYYYFC